MKFDTLCDFSEVSRIGIRVIDTDGQEVFSTPRYLQAVKALSDLTVALGAEESTRSVMVKSCSLSVRYGGLYVFLCPLGLTYITSPITRADECSMFAICGPMILSNRDDYLDFEILPRVAKSDFVAIRGSIDAIPVVDASFIAPLSEQLFVNTVFTSGGHSPGLSLEDDIAATQEGVAAREAAESLKRYRLRSYMFKDQQEAREQSRLSETLLEHENEQARELLNEILEQVLFRPHNNIDYIKSKIMEYVMMLYRSAIHDGIDVKTVIQLKNRAFLEIDELESLDDAIVWLNNINEEFSARTFKNLNSKHAEVIRESMNYVMEHYAEKIALEDVAEHVSFSPTYLSTLFKSETGQSFKSCMNKIRIEKSKELMDDDSMSIADIGYAVGFSDQSYFARVFKQYEGVSPYHFRLTRGKNV